MKKKIFVIILFLSISIIGLTNSAQSANEDNAFLKTMRINKEGIEPDFEKEITEYYVIVNETIKDLEVTAISENPEATVEIIGNNNLVNGINKIEIIVKSKDKTNEKTYTINVTKTSNVEKANANLENLAIENVMLFPEFQSRITEYKAEVGNDVNKLNILAIPENQQSKITIQGEEELKEGTNKVIINILAENKITEKRYIVNIYKRNDKEEEEKLIQQKLNEQKIAQITSNNEKENHIKKVNTEIEIKKEKNNMTIYVVIITIIILIIGIIILKIKNK